MSASSLVELSDATLLEAVKGFLIKYILWLR